jgi:hypothetical protein
MPRTIRALCGITIAAGFIVLSSAVVILHSDVAKLQAQQAARNPGASQMVPCSSLPHLKVHGRTVRCSP